MRRSWCLALLTCLLAGAGCANRVARHASIEPTTRPTTQEAERIMQALADPEWDPDLQALIAPPLGWQPSVMPNQLNAIHYLWISPSGKTAYGVIRFSLPFPAPYEPVLWVFLREIRKKEGHAALLAKSYTPGRRSMSFTVEGGRYTIRTTLVLRGLSGWMTYAGTLREHPVEPGELQVAETARDKTEVGSAARRGE
jgi:hypothetical protein